MYIDTPQVHHITAAVDLVDANTFTIQPSNLYCPIISKYYGVYACGTNVFLQAHQDNDFTYSAVSPHMRTPYLLKNRLDVHFLFPWLVIVISLCPDYFLFF